MTERIVVGLNGSGSSNNALTWAAKRAAKRNAELALVHIVDRGVGLFDAPEFLHDARVRGEELLGDVAEEAKRIAPGVRVTTELLEESGISEAFAELSEDAALIVVGSDSRGERAGEEQRGTHSYRVAAGSKAPVLVIPDIDAAGRRGVVVGVDGSEVSNNAIAYAAAEADQLGEPLIAVSAWMEPRANFGREYVFTPEILESIALSTAQEQDEALRQVVEQYPELEIERVVENGDPARALLQRAQNASLLVVGSHGRGTFRRLLLGSVSHAVLSSLVAPTVVHR